MKVKLKKNLFNILFTVILILSIARLGYDLIIADEINLKQIKRGLTLIILIVGLLTGSRSVKTRSTKKTVNLYRNEYGKYIDNAFVGRSTLKKRLNKAICFFHNSKYDQALKILDSLYDKCESTDDYCGVLLFKGLCFQYTGDIQKNIDTYEELLRYNGTLPDIWCFLGMAYFKKEDYDNFARCNETSLVYDSQNPNAFANLGSYYFRVGQTEKALEYALRALRIQSSLIPAMSTAAAAYCVMGDVVGCEKYKRMYIANGGNAQNINAYIQGLSSQRQN